VKYSYNLNCLSCILKYIDRPQKKSLFVFKKANSRVYDWIMIILFVNDNVKIRQAQIVKEWLGWSMKNHFDTSESTP